MGLLAQQSVHGDNSQILTRFGAGDNQIKVLWEPKIISHNVFSLATKYSGFLQSLRMKVQIASLDEIPLPSLPPEMGRVEKATSLRDMEWKNPRKQISFLMSHDGSDYYNLFSISLQKRIPYFTVNLLPYLTDNADFLLSSDTKIAAQIINAGWGGLVGEDEVVIYGAVAEEAYFNSYNLDDFHNQCDEYGLDIGGESVLIRPANYNRKSLSIINNSTYRVWLSFGKQAVIGRGVLLNGGGSSYTVNRNSYYNGSIYAVSEANSNIVGVECSS